MLHCKWKLWCHNHSQTLTITTFLVCYLLTRNLDVVSAVTISFRETQPHAGSQDANDKVYSVPTYGDSNLKSISLKAKQLLKVEATKKNFNSDDSAGYAAEWEYKGSGLEELDEPTEKQLSPSWSGKNSGTATHPSLSVSPSRRLGPGTWLDSSSGYYWLFGGQGATASANQTTHINYLSDLWVYGAPSPTNPTPNDTHSQDPYWRLVYRPTENDGDSPLSANPENLLFPLLCGSGHSGHLSLFKGQNWGSEKSTESSNSLFNEDSVMWVSDIPKGYKEIPSSPVKSAGGGGNGCNWQMSNEGGSKRRSCNGTEGLLWTSYICCDACLSDGNTTFDFCPQFSKEPILWCNEDSLMAFQLNVKGTSIKSKREIALMAKGEENTTPSYLTAPNGEINQQRNSTEETLSVEEKVEETSPKSHISPTTTIQPTMVVVMKNGSNSRGEGQLKKLRSSSSYSQEGNEKKDNIKLATGEQEQEKAMREAVKQSAINEPEVLPLSTTISTQREIFSTTQKNVSESLVVNWWKFDLTSTEWVKMPEVNISSEEAEQIHSGNCRSVSDQHFLYILCPTKGNVLDRSVLLFDPITSHVQSLGTIHLNNAFHDKKVWQLGRSAITCLRANNQTIIFLAYHKLLDLWIHDHSSNRLMLVENVWKGASLHAFQHTNSFYKLKLVLSTEGDGSKEHSLYMINPRNKLYMFQDPFPDGYFKITIVTDRLVFLPSRDAPTLINATADLDSTKSLLDGTGNVKRWPIQQKKMPMTASGKVQGKFFKYDQRAWSQISITKPNASSSESSGGGRNKTGSLVGLLEGQRTAGSRKGLSSYMNKTANLTFGGEKRVEKAEKVSSSTSSPDEKVEYGERSKTSQSKFNPGPSSPKNYNKTNNSQLKGTGEKSKRILGIKRTLTETTRSASSSSEAVGISSSAIDGKELANEMRSLASRGSLPVNNESNRKPLQPTFGSQKESQTLSNANSRPKVLAVVRGSVNTIRIRPDHPSSSSSSSSTQVRNETKWSEESNSNKTLNLSISSPISETLALKVAPGSGEESQEKSLPPNFLPPQQPDHISSDSSIQSKLGHSSIPQKLSPTTRKEKALPGYENQDEGEEYSLQDGDGDKPNLENNYVSSRRGAEEEKRRKEKGSMSHASNESFMGDMAIGGRRDLMPLTYGSSKILIDSSHDQVQSISDEASEASYYTSYSTFGSLIFFSLSLSIFAFFGIFTFVRHCVKWRPRGESVLIKEPPPIRYSVVPDELSFNHTPLV